MSNGQDFKKALEQIRSTLVCDLGTPEMRATMALNQIATVIHMIDIERDKGLLLRQQYQADSGPVEETGDKLYY